MSKTTVDWKNADEAALREAEAPWPKSIDELSSFVETMATRDHDYGTCVYAMSLASVAAFHYIAHRLGVTGFQASCADLDALKRTRGMKHGFRITDYANLLYPQYWDEEHFPTPQQMLRENAARLVPEARRLLAETPGAAKSVREHWERIAATPVPTEEPR